MKNTKEYDRNWYLKNKHRIKDKKIKRSKDARIRNSQFIVDYLRRNPCVDCGEADFRVLEFDHNGDKKYTISNMASGFSIKSIEDEISKCVVRCANCHRRKTCNEFGWYKNIK